MSRLDMVIAQLATLDPQLRALIDSETERWRDEVWKRGGPEEAQWIPGRAGRP